MLEILKIYKKKERDWFIGEIRKFNKGKMWNRDGIWGKDKEDGEELKKKEERRRGLKIK
jgi:hypothetical protein